MSWQPLRLLITVCQTLPFQIYTSIIHALNITLDFQIELGENLLLEFGSFIGYSIAILGNWLFVIRALRILLVCTWRTLKLTKDSTEIFDSLNFSMSFKGNFFRFSFKASDFKEEFPFYDQNNIVRAKYVIFYINFDFFERK